MDDSTNSSPTTINERQQSIVERRPMFVSSEGAPRPLSCVGQDAEGAASDTVRGGAVYGDPQELKLREFTSTLVLTEDQSDCSLGLDQSNWASPTAVRNRGLRSRVGERLGNSVIALNNLKQQYAHLVDLNPLSGRDPCRPPSAQDLTTLLSSMQPDDVVQHCIQLHRLIQEAAGMTAGSPPTIPEGSAAVTDLFSPPFTADASVGESVPPVIGGQPPPTNMSTGGFGQEAPESPADLQQSTSTMSLVAEPVRTTREARKSIDDDGSKMINNYVVLDDLGRGSCGKVKLAFDTNLCRMVAIKILRKPSSWSSDASSEATVGGNACHHLPENGRMISRKQTQHMALQREIAVMKKLRHKNIVSLYEVIDDPDAEKLYIVMQYVDNGSVGKVAPDGTCTTVPAGTLLHIAEQLLIGLQYLHARGIVHRDIKPENILVNTEGDAFLADFGVSEYLERPSLVSGHQSPHEDSDALVSAESVNVEGQRGTRLFMAPELLRLETTSSMDESNIIDRGSNSSPGGTVKGRTVDTWALGVTLYALIIGRLPFANVEQILDETFVPVEMVKVPAPWKPLIHGLLDRKWEIRWTAVQARQYIKSIMLDGSDTDDMVLSDRDGAPMSNGASSSITNERSSSRLIPQSRSVLVVDEDLWNAFTPVSRKPPVRAAKVSSETAELATASLRSLLTPPDISLGSRRTRDGSQTLQRTTSTDVHKQGVPPKGKGKGSPQSVNINGIKLRNAVVLDLSTLDNGKTHLVSTTKRSGGGGATIIDVANITFPGVEPTVEAAPAARRENSKCARRLQQLIDEQQLLETQRRIIPQGEFL